MQVKTITANISYSLQLENGAWKKIELGAEAELGPSDDWDADHVKMYAGLATHLEAIWPRDERHSRTQPATPPPPATLCSTHGKGKPSRSGGMYCPTKLPDGTYCLWTSEAQTKS